MSNAYNTIQEESYLSPQKKEQRESSCLHAKNFADKYCGGAPKAKILYLPGKEALEQPILDKYKFARKNMFMVNHNHAYIAVLNPSQKRSIPKSQIAGVGIHYAMERFEKNNSKIDYAILDFMHMVCPNSISVMRHIGSSEAWSDTLGISLTTLDQRENGNGASEGVQNIADKYCNGNKSLARSYIMMQAFCSSRGRFFYPLKNKDFASYHGETVSVMVNAHFVTKFGPVPLQLQPMIHDINLVLLRVTSTKSDIIRSSGSSKMSKKRKRIQGSSDLHGNKVYGLRLDGGIDRRCKETSTANNKIKNSSSHLDGDASNLRNKRSCIIPRPGIKALWEARHAYLALHPNCKTNIIYLTWEKMNK